MSSRVAQFFQKAFPNTMLSDTCDLVDVMCPSQTSHQPSHKCHTAVMSDLNNDAVDVAAAAMAEGGGGEHDQVKASASHRQQTSDSMLLLCYCGSDSRERHAAVMHVILLISQEAAAPAQ